MDIMTTRLEREFDLNIVTTAPSVIYRVNKTSGEFLMIDNPANLPPVTEIASIEEPFVHATIYTPQDAVGTLMDLCQDKRGIFLDMQYEGARIKLNYELPLNEIIFDFFDQIKSRSRGYASFDYEMKDYRQGDLVKLDILLNGELCDAFSIIVHREKAYARGRSIAEKLKDVIPRQQFDIAIQAAIGAKIIARETVKQVRKDVTAKCYGGDVSRKRKLLEKQKRGKKRMKQIGNVEVPQKAFLAVLKLD
jgi:GTP-binding protein LepA